jgi:hypothetical protein
MKSREHFKSALKNTLFTIALYYTNVMKLLRGARMQRKKRRRRKNADFKEKRALMVRRINARQIILG